MYERAGEGPIGTANRPCFASYPLLKLPSFPGLSQPTTSPLLSCLLLLIVIAPIFVRLILSLSLSLPTLKGITAITAIVATDRAGHYASAFAADTVTVLTSFAPGVDPKVKTVTGGRGRELRGRSNDVVVAPSHM